MEAFFANLTSKKAFLIIATIGILVFSNSIFNGFVGDDDALISDNPIVHSISNIGLFFKGSNFFNGDRPEGIWYRPLQSVVFSSIYTVFGPNPAPFHTFQIILHIVNTFLLFLILKRFFKPTLSLVLSIIFLVHPINSQAIFYISATQDLMFFFFGMVAMWFLIYGKSAKNLILVSLFLMLSLLSKEAGVLFFGLALVYSFIFQRKYFYSLLGLITAIFVGYLILRSNTVGLFQKIDNVPIASLSLSKRLVTTPSVFFFYIKTFLFPFHLSLYHSWFSINATFGNFFAPLFIDFAVLVLIVGFGIYLYRKFGFADYFKDYLFFGAWFFIGLSLYLQFLPIDATVGEHWFYFPMVGLLGMIGVCIGEFKKVNEKIVLVIAIGLIAVLSVTTFIRSFDWRNGFSLYSHDLTVSKNDYALENGMGFVLIKQGKFSEAKLYTEKSIADFPYITNYNNLGTIYVNLGDYNKAKEAYLNAIKIGDYYLSYEALAGLTLTSEANKENLNFLKTALSKFPNSANLWLYLAIYDYKSGNKDDAKMAITKAYYLDTNPNITFFYQKIINNQPFELNFKAGN